MEFYSNTRSLALYNVIKSVLNNGLLPITEIVILSNTKASDFVSADVP